VARSDPDLIVSYVYQFSAGIIPQIRAQLKPPRLLFRNARNELGRAPEKCTVLSVHSRCRVLAGGKGRASCAAHSRARGRNQIGGALAICQSLEAAHLDAALPGATPILITVQERRRRVLERLRGDRSGPQLAPRLKGRSMANPAATNGPPIWLNAAGFGAAPDQTRHFPLIASWLAAAGSGCGLIRRCGSKAWPTAARLRTDPLPFRSRRRCPR
jgi:hypothetical protein